MGPTLTAIRRMRGLTLLLAVVAFSMVGCIRYELGFTVNADGSGALSALVAISDQFTQATGSTAEQALGLGDESLPGAEITEYKQDGFTGIQMSVPFANLQQLGLLMGSSESDAIATDFELQPDGEGGWRFATVMGPVADPSGVEAPPSPELLQGAWGRVRVQLPGDVAEHNADRIEDGAFVWEIDFTSTEPRQLTATTTGAAAAGTSDAAPASPATGHGVATATATASQSSTLGAIALGIVAVATVTAGVAARRRRVRA